MKFPEAKVPWIAIWCLILAVAVGIGVATRLSYTDIGQNPESVRDLPWLVSAYIPEAAESQAAQGEDASPEALFDRATLVVLASPTNERKYMHKTFLAQMRVKQVIKGTPQGAGQEIGVFEPVGIYDLPGGKTLNPQDAYLFGGTFMRPAEDYLLLLREAPKSSGVTAYTFLPAIYAKIPVGELAYYKIDPTVSTLSYADVSQFDLLVQSEDDATTFKQKQKELLYYVRNKGLKTGA